MGSHGTCNNMYIVGSSNYKRFAKKYSRQLVYNAVKPWRSVSWPGIEP